jgi:hypothetical protein
LEVSCLTLTAIGSDVMVVLFFSKETDEANRTATDARETSNLQNKSLFALDIATAPIGYDDAVTWKIAFDTVAGIFGAIYKYSATGNISGLSDINVSLENKKRLVSTFQYIKQLYNHEVPTNRQFIKIELLH